MNLRSYISAAISTVVIAMAAQETAPVTVSPDIDRQTAPIVQPTKPTWTTPPTSLGTTTINMPKLELTPGDLTDSIAAYSMNTNTGEVMPMSTRYNFSMNPYSNNWWRSGVIATAGGGYLVGNGSFQAMPALGNIGTASLQWIQPLGEQLTVSVGATGNKYHFGRDAWNDYGVNASARYSLTNRLALKAWGNYYFNPQFYSMAALPYLGSSNYGGSLEMMFTERVGLELGAQRYMDPLTGRWRTVPVIAPTVNILGAPISIDFGGLVGNLFDKKRMKDTPIDPMKSYDPKQQHGVMAPPPAGFNPHSPVRVPDALRK